MLNILTNDLPMYSRIFILMTLILLCQPSFAQTTQGRIAYEITLDVHRRIPPEREEMKAMIPRYRTEMYELLYHEQATLYKKMIDEEEDLSTSRGGVRMMFRSPKSVTHVQKDLKVRTVQQDFMGKKYLITDTLALPPWKIGQEQMEIEGYLCQMAYYTDDSDTTNIQEITAWFALQLPPFTGPEGYGTLPGTVLALDINNGERVIVARKLEFREIRGQEVTPPDKGEKVQREAYRKIVNEQVEKMRNQGGWRSRN